MNNNRAHSLDALRGYAIMTMILSAMEAFSILPRWMYHAQVPPPAHIFNPHIFGITWVDLIFPFFLFSMGAAIPLSLGRQLAKGTPRRQLLWKSVVRWVKLTFYAIFIIHMFPYMLGYEQEWMRYTLPLVAFALMFVLFMRNPFHLSSMWNRVVTWLAYAVAIAWMLIQPYAGGKSFSLNDSDIIMLILANVSLAGAVIYLLTPKRILWRLAFIPLIMAVFLSSKTDNSWQQWLYNFTPAHWLYQFRYLEYLLIIIPGTIAGDLISRWLQREELASVHAPLHQAPFVAPLSLMMIVCNVACLYNRVMVLNLILTAVLLVLLYLLLRKEDEETHYWKKLYLCGTYLLLLGLFIEAFEGGIRKDDVTFSYLFVTGGLAFFGLLFFTVVSDHYHVRWLCEPLELVGRNPMLAYVSGSMVVVPILMLTHIYPFIDSWSSAPLPGFLKGVLLTALCMSVTSYFTIKKKLWKS
ncbi:MAG: DUF5009 domain-containing protein [Prevotella sp.]|jgi:predicted acyltransferase|nr:DUF5009 domain-containing protein [Prevotella sp.]MCI1282039.1 DUF5009 domain-containing protein [Prevotella sp.]